MDERMFGSAERLSDRFMKAAVILLAVAIVAVALSLLVPVGTAGGTTELSARRGIAALPAVGVDLGPLLVKMAGVRLIKPPQAQAAVKDTGAAAKLAKKLHLQGVVKMGEELVAYIQVDKAGVKTVRQGGQILEFLVERVEPGRVTLSLQGVQVVLEH